MRGRSIAFRRESARRKCLQRIITHGHHTNVRFVFATSLQRYGCDAPCRSAWGSACGGLWFDGTGIGVCAISCAAPHCTGSRGLPPMHAHRARIVPERTFQVHETRLSRKRSRCCMGTDLAARDSLELLKKIVKPIANFRSHSS